MTDNRPAVKEIRFSDGTPVPLDADELVVLVGGNNVGKSTVLKDIFSLIGGSEQSHNPIVVKAASMHEREPNLIIKKYASTEKRTVGDRVLHFINGTALQVLDNYSMANVRGIMRVLVDYLDSSKLSGICCPNIEAIGANRTHEAKNPFQLLLHNTSLRNQFYEQCESIFGAGPLIDALHGNPLTTYWGKRPSDTTDPSDPHSARIRQFPKLHEQGDGTKRVVAILASLLVRKKAMYFVDEPEIHLHPPQCVKLAKEIASSARDCQMFIATHSIDFLHGLLDCKDIKLKIIRITREGNINKPFILSPGQLKELWNDSYLRYSKILEGIFYNKVVLCEADADCRFYQFVYDNRIATDQSALFCPVGGKAKFKQLVAPLRAIGLAPKIIIDLDGLNGSTLGDILKGLDFNNEWKSIQNDLQHVKEAIEASKESVKINDVKESLLKHFGSISEEIATKDNLKKLKDLIPSPSAWTEVKHKGVACFSDIEQKTNKPLIAPFERVNNILLKCGILLVPVGELECWLKCGKGPKHVLQKMAQHPDVNDPIYNEVTEFLKKL